MSQEYIGALALLLMSVLKIFGVELENGVLEGTIAGVIALWVAIRRKMDKNRPITITGARIN